MQELIKKTRTFRRFYEEKRIPQEILRQIVDISRFGGSARNCQPLQYLVISDRSLCREIFPLLGWAGYLANWKGPDPGERPAAYILCLLNKTWLKGPETEATFDLGIATQNMLLVAREQGIGGCRIGSFSSRLQRILSLNADVYKLLLVLALGFPKEIVQLEDMRNGDVKYWRDEKGVHHVPKRSLEDILYSPIS